MFFRATIEKEDVDPKCRVSGKEVESVGHVVIGWILVWPRGSIRGGTIGWEDCNGLHLGKF